MAIELQTTAVLISKTAGLTSTTLVLQNPNSSENVNFIVSNDDAKLLTVGLSYSVIIKQFSL